MKDGSCVKLDRPQDRFVESLLRNHIHVAQGDWKEELLVTRKVLDIELLVP